MLLWIGFNAAYAGDLDRAVEGNERERFEQFFAALVCMDSSNRIYDAIWQRFAHEIRLLPVFIDLMMDHPDAEWAMPMYPVVEG